jgi:hypothetical protein
VCNAEEQEADEEPTEPEETYMAFLEDRTDYGIALYSCNSGILSATSARLSLVRLT